MAKRINNNPANSLILYFWSVISHVSVKVVSIDCIKIDKNIHDLKTSPVVFSLFRNDKNREVELNILYEVNYWILAFHTFFLIFCAWLIDFLLIKPISHSQQIWMQRLIADGYDDNEALSKSLLIPAQKDLSETQESTFNLLH